MTIMNMDRSLLAASDVGGDVVSILFWGAVLAVLVVGLGYGLFALRRWWLGEDVPDAAPEWTLQDLRELKAKGALSEAEYESLRGAAIAGVTRPADMNDSDADGASDDGFT